MSGWQPAEYYLDSLISTYNVLKSVRSVSSPLPRQSLISTYNVLKFHSNDNVALRKRGLISTYNVLK